MPLTLSAAGGDGVTAAAYRVNVSLPDSGTTIAVNASYQAPLIVSGVAGQSMAAVVNSSTSTVTSPGVPGSGTEYWLCEMNTSTGALTVKSSNSSMPAVDAGSVVLFQQTIASTASSAPSLQGNLTFPFL